MIQRNKNRNQQFRLNFDRLERREVMTGAPVLMVDGAAASQSTWGIVPTPPLEEALCSIYKPFTVITKDVNGNTIDFNKDGYPDLLETGGIDGLIGYGSNTEPQAYLSRTTFGKVAFGGPNGLVFSTQTKPGLLVPIQTTGEYQAVMDLNGDGYQDILTTAVANEKPGTGFTTRQYLFNPQQQTFVETRNTAVINGWAWKTGAMTLGDVTGDGLLDLVLPYYSTTTVPLQGQSAAVFPMLGYQVFAGVANPSTGKWVGDFAPNALTTLPLKQPSAEWGLGTYGDAPDYDINFDPGTLVINTVLADFNGDGKLDLATPEADGITVYPNPGNGAFTPASGLFTQSAGAANGLNLVAADLNNDGKTDLASSPNYVSAWLMRYPNNSYRTWNASSAPLSVYLNTTSSGGPISFSASGVNAFNDPLGYNGSLAIADFNGDGNADMAVGSGNNQSTSYGILTGDGTGKFAAMQIYSGYSNAADGYDDNFRRAINGLAVADFNRDGQVDIVTTARNIGPAGSNTQSNQRLSGPAVGITGVAYNKTFALPGVNPQSLTAYVGQPLALTIQPTGGDPSKVYLFSLNPKSVPLPPGVTLSPTGQLSGTPTVSGPYQLTIDITQPNGPRSTVWLNLNVTTPQQSAILPGIMPNAVAGLPFQQQLTTTLGPANWLVSGGALPSGLSLSQGGLISGTPMALGTYSFTVLGTGSGFQSVMNYQMLVQPSAAPVVTNLVRYGYHAQPTTLVATFSQPLDATSAGNVANYVLTSAGADGRFGTRDDKNIPLASASYNTASNSVTLRLVQKNIPLRQLYRLGINGTPTAGLQNTGGIFLGGQGVGAPGTNYVQIFSGKILAGPNNLMKTTKKAKG